MKTRVALLWHHHQPFYQDLVTGEHILPWVRLHALKDYYGMAALLREFPDVRLTFNLVPSLLVQLEAFAEDRARDRHLEVGLKPAEHLTDEERTFLVDELLSCAARADDRRRTRATASCCGSASRAMGPPPPHGSSPSARSATCRCGTSSRGSIRRTSRRDPRVRGLVQKGRHFEEDDKALLREVELEILRKVIPEYAAAAARGQVELSTSPFYHPILPLLCDTDVYLRTHPHSRMPRQRFRHPEDAAEQLRQGRRVPRAHVRRAAARAVAVGGVGIGCGGAAGARRGPAVDGDRRADPGAEPRARR